MNMSILNIATKANQASTLPAILVAHYVDQKGSIKVNYEDVHTLKSDDKVSIELIQENSASTYGCGQVIDELISTHPPLQSKIENTVSAYIHEVQRFED